MHASHACMNVQIHMLGIEVSKHQGYVLNSKAGKQQNFSNPKHITFKINQSNREKKEISIHKPKP